MARRICAPFTWFATADHRLGNGVSQALSDSSNNVFLSVASIWEMAIKASLGKIALHVPLESIPVQAAHALRVDLLPFHHRDPFDHLLIGQALEDGLTIATRDEAIKAYTVRTLWD
ncbi:MAG: type II toxin-antitoxin system VapC family toxin [Deltaproteobacteria bacterium]|nr:type II toxin-antitoxin system VapC family toxin [Deltaproteobacteria bacterium]